MDRRSQIGQRSSVHFAERNFHCRTRGQGFQVLEDSPHQFVVLSPPAPSNVGHHYPVVFQRVVLIFQAFFFAHLLCPYHKGRIADTYTIRL